MDIFKTMIVAAPDVVLVRDICTGLGANGVGMFITPLSATGNNPATHYVSTGYIPEQFIYLLSDANSLHYVANEAGVVCTLEEVMQLLDNADVTDDEPSVAFERLSLQIINEVTL